MNISDKMKRDWDRRARHDARFWIATDDYQTEAEFHRSGEATRRELLDLLGSRYQREWTVLEVGCGIGRVLRPLARDFSSLHGVDVSAEMIAQSRQRLADLPNVHTHENSGVDLHDFAAASVDFVYSFVAFQHMPKQVFEVYLAEIHRVLAPGGWLGFQIMVGRDPEPDFADTIGLRVYGAGELRELLKGRGFAVETLRIDGPGGRASSAMLLARRVESAPAAVRHDWLGESCADVASPLDEHLHVCVARSALDDGRSADAIRHLRALVGAYPANLEAWTELAWLLIEERRLEEAERVLEATLRAHPNCSAARDHLSSLRRAMPAPTTRLAGEAGRKLRSRVDSRKRPVGHGTVEETA